MWGKLGHKLYIGKFREVGASLAGKHPCILNDGDSKWYSPVQFQDVGGRSAAKNWKKSISHQGQGLFKFLDWLTSAECADMNSESVDDTNSSQGSHASSSVEALDSQMDKVLHLVESTIMEKVKEIIAQALRPIKNLSRKKYNIFRLSYKS